MINLKDSKFSKLEDKESFVSFMNACQHGDEFIFVFLQDTEVLCKFDCLYYADNNLETNDPLYKEFYAVAMGLVSIINGDKEKVPFIRTKDVLTEFSNGNAPLIIKRPDGEILWRKK